MSDLYFPSDDATNRNNLSKLRKANRLRKIAPRIYTSDFDLPAEQIIRENIFRILGELYPGAVLSHRSAFEFKPTATGNLFLTYLYTKKIKLPGITLNFIQGPGPLDGDNKFFGELYISSKERAFLENLQISKKIGPDSKVLSIPELKERLEKILSVNGGDALNALRDKASEYALLLNMGREYSLLDKIIGALFSTKPAKILKSASALSRAMGLPYDKERVKLFEVLFHHLHTNEFKIYDETCTGESSYRNFAFFEAYFSNYIEGTEFEVEEAKKIIDSGVPLAARSGDSHDVLGTYQIVSRRKEMSRLAEDSDEFMDLLRERHKVILSARLDRRPGEFKTRNNRAGNTFFTDYELVKGTLKRGFEFYRALTNPFSCAAYMMFLISEVHPFEDGNGRIARIMMNAELVSRNSCKIIIPTVYREDYLLTLKKLTNSSDPEPYVRMLHKAYTFSRLLAFDNYDELYAFLKARNAFYDADSGRYLIFD